MKFLSHNGVIYTLGGAYVALSAYLIVADQALLSLLSIGLLLLYSILYYTRYAFLALAFLAPLSVNIEEYVDGFGLFLPTEPILAALLALAVFLQLRKPFVPAYIYRHPLFVTASLYLVWLFISSLPSSDVVTSLKFFVARCWLMVPLLIFGGMIFKHTVNVRAFIWLFVTGMTLAGTYTLMHHAQYGFGEEEGHWVMWPFFKDHTIYGAAVAMGFVLSIGLYFSKKFPPLTQATLTIMIVILAIALYFSYTRAAWLSIVGAAGIGVVIYFRVRWTYLLALAGVAGIVLILSWDRIQMELARNKYEHTTENFSERLQSATNVTTDASNLERLNRWSCAWEMFKERPHFGFGPGTYAFEYARFQHSENITIISTNFGDAGNAHSEFLGPLSETGWPGLLTVIALIFTIFYSGIQLYYRLPNELSELKTLVFFGVLAISTYFIHGLLNNYLDTDKAAVPIWGMGAIFIALQARYSFFLSNFKNPN